MSVLFPPPRAFDAEETCGLLAYPQLVDELKQVIEESPTAPLRTTIPERDDRLVMVMPATSDEYWIVKIVSVVPSNRRISIPTVAGIVLLFEAEHGNLVASFDGGTITRRRTAAVSALASKHLAAKDSSKLVVVGTGAQAEAQAEAHIEILKTKHVRVWGRTRLKAEVLTERLRVKYPWLDVSATHDLEGAVGWADVTTVATLAKEPIVFGRWLKKGGHLDLVGAHSKTTREVDSEAISRSIVFVDFDSAFEEAGELALAVAEGAIANDHVAGNLRTLFASSGLGRVSAGQTTVFKAAGSAVGDLAAARLAWRSATINKQ